MDRQGQRHSDDRKCPIVELSDAESSVKAYSARSPRGSHLTSVGALRRVHLLPSRFERGSVSYSVRPFLIATPLALDDVVDSPHRPLNHVADQKYTPEDILRIAWRRKWLILLPFIVGSVGAVLLRERLRISSGPNDDPRRPQRIPKTTSSRPSPPGLKTAWRRFNRRSSADRARTHHHRLNLYPEQRRTLPMEDVVERMRQRSWCGFPARRCVQLAYVSEIRVSLSGSPRSGVLFIDANLQDREQMAEGTNQFLDAQLEDARPALLEQEKRLEEYRRKNMDSLPRRPRRTCAPSRRADAGSFARRVDQRDKDRPRPRTAV